MSGSADRAAAPDRVSRRRWPWFVAGALLVVVVLGALVLPRLVDVERHRERVEQALREATGWEAELGRIELSILRGPALRVSPARLAAPEGGSRFEATAVSVRAALMPLFRGRLEIESVTLVEPDITLVRPDAKRGWIVPSVVERAPAEGAAAPGGAQGAVSVGRISVRDGALRLEDRSVAPANSLAIENVDVELTASSGEMVGSGTVVGDGGRIEWTGRAGGLLEVEFIGLRTDAIGPWLGEGVLHPGGRLAGTVSLAPGDGVTGTLTGETLRLLAGSHPLPETEVEFRFLPDDSGWQAERLELKAGEARIVGTGSLLPLSLKLELPATPIDVALELIEALVPLGLDLSPPGSARVTVRIDSSDEGDLSYEAEGELTAARFAAAELLPEATDLRTTFRLSRGGALELHILDGSVGGGPLNGTVRIDSVDPLGTLTFDGKVDGAALGILLGGFVDRAPERVTGPAAVSGMIAVDLAAPSLDASSIRGALALGADDVSLSGWDLEGAFRAKLREKLGKLGQVAALLDSDAREALQEEAEGAEDAARRLLERLAADVSFDTMPWGLEKIRLQSGGLSAEGRGSFDPLSAEVDLRLTAVADTALTSEFTERYPQLRSLLDRADRLTLPMRIRGPLVEPELDVDLKAIAAGSLDVEEPEEALRGLLEGVIDRKILKKKK